MKGVGVMSSLLFQVVSTYLKHAPRDEAVYQFIDKKRAEGKRFYVYMTAGANKFLRIFLMRYRTRFRRCFLGIYMAITNRVGGCP
jgi:hypothetical protein